LDLTTPGHQLPSGACRLLWDLVPTGRGDGAVWEVPKVADRRGTSTGILSLGWQRRSNMSRFADLAGDPDQSLNRLIALKADGVYIIDPGQGYTEKQVHTFDTADDTRRASFSQGQQIVHIAITSGPGVGAPEQGLVLHGDTVAEYGWPELPIMSVSTTLTNGDGGLDAGTYLFRFAWELDTGAVGPAGSLVEVSESGPFKVRAKILRFTEALPDYWKQRISKLLVVGHAPVQKTDDQGNTTTTIPARRQPGYRLTSISTLEVGFGASWEGTTEDLLTQRDFEGSAIQHHRLSAGASYNYNARLLLGDLAYDLKQPPLKKILRWKEGRENANGNDQWVLLTVWVETTDGEVVRNSAPLPYDTASAEAASLRSNLVWYPDPRALRWEMYKSTDYTEGDPLSSATWQSILLPGSDRSFEEAAAATFAYSDVKDPLDLTVASSDGAVLDVGSENGWTGPLSAGESLDENDVSQGNSDQINTDKVSRLSEADVTGSSQDVVEVTVDYYIKAEVETQGQNDRASAEAFVRVAILDADKNVLVSDKSTVSAFIAGGTTGDTGTNSFEDDGSITLSGFDPAEAEYTRIENEVFVSVDNNNDGGTIRAFAQSSNNQKSDVQWKIQSVADDTHAVTDGQNEKLSIEPNLIVWSEPYRPMERPAENLVSDARSQDDRVLALQAVGQEVSEGQYGQYPILSFQQDSVRVLRVGEGSPLVQRVDVLTNDQGAVSRAAVASADGSVVACLDGGLHELAPQLQQPPLSNPLNDVGEEFLRSLGPDTVVGHYKNVQRGRNDVWVAAGGRVWNYSIDQGAWSALRRQRQDFALRPGEEYAARADGALVREVATEGEGQVNIQTAVLQTGALGSLKRMRQVQLRQPTPLEEVDLSLVATDPQREYIKLERETLRAGQLSGGVVPDAGLGTGFVLDIRGRALTGQSIESIFIEWDLRNRTLRDHQAHEYPAYLDAPDLVQSQDQTQATTLVLIAETDV
jgi:hypothetical protein